MFSNKFTVVASSLSFLFMATTAQATTTLGVGMGIMPKYEGAKKYKAQAYPLFSYEKDNFFLGPKVEKPSAGLQVHLADNWKVGVFGSYVDSRKSRKDAHLQGMNDISHHAAAGVFSSIYAGDFAFDVTYYHALKEGYGGGVEVGGVIVFLKQSNLPFV